VVNTYPIHQVCRGCSRTWAFNDWSGLRIPVRTVCIPCLEVLARRYEAYA